ncbi:MAG: sulfatase/phosphatase domain-containing protein [Verrucomicrobiota bacterium]
MGTIHRRHRTSEAYSLGVMEAAIRRAQPDVVLTEIPPDRIERALTTFRETGLVDEPRTQLFPEYTDVLFPLAEELDVRIFGTAAWTKAIADERRAALARIRSDPARAEQWAEHQSALREFAEAMQGRSLLPVLRGKTPQDWRKYHYYHYYESGGHGVALHYGITDGQHKLIRFPEPKIDAWEYYDLESDPNELESTYGDPTQSQTQNRLAKELERLREQFQVD